MQLNFGYCTLLVMEDIDLIPPEEVADVSVQLVTYNGNGKSAYGSLWVQFEFTDGEPAERIEIEVLSELSAEMRND